MAIPENISSVGQAAAAMQAMPSRISEVARQLEIVPVLRINGIPHYDDRDLALIADYLRDRSVHQTTPREVL